MKIKRNYVFFPDKEGNETIGYKPDAKLRMRIRYGKNVINFSVGYRVDLSKWVAESQRCKANTTHGKKKVYSTEINSRIQEFEEMADKVFSIFESIGTTPSLKEFRNEFNNLNGKAPNLEAGNDLTVVALFDQFMADESVKNGWTIETRKRINTVRGHLYKYNEKLHINNVTEAEAQGFIDYMMHKACLRNTTVAKNINFFRWFLRWAHNREYYTGRLHSTWKPRLKGTDGNQKEVIHLTWDELLHLYSFPVPESKQYLSRARDVFCFQCFTSLRYSDVAKLSKADIKDGYISVVTQKTVDGLRIELNDYSREILEKYKGFDFPSGRALPVVTNQKMNVFLKELGKLAGIDEPQRIVYFQANKRHEEVYPKHELLTTHCGRRTFIVNAMYLGIPAEVIMRWTGHSDYKAMKPYIKIVDQLKAKEMDKFNRRK